MKEKLKKVKKLNFLMNLFDSFSKTLNSDNLKIPLTIIGVLISVVLTLAGMIAFIPQTHGLSFILGPFVGTAAVFAAGFGTWYGLKGISKIFNLISSGINESIVELKEEIELDKSKKRSLEDNIETLEVDKEKADAVIINIDSLVTNIMKVRYPGYLEHINTLLNLGQKYIQEKEAHGITKGWAMNMVEPQLVTELALIEANIDESIRLANSNSANRTILETIKAKLKELNIEFNIGASGDEDPSVIVKSDQQPIQYVISGKTYRADEIPMGDIVAMTSPSETTSLNGITRQRLR